MTLRQTAHRRRQSQHRKAGPALRREAVVNGDAQVASLLKLSSYLVGALDPQTTIRADLMAHMVEALPAIQAGILWIELNGRLRLTSTAGLPLSPLTEQALLACQLRPGEGLAGQVWQHGEPRLIVCSQGYRAAAEPIGPANEALFLQLSEILPPQTTVAAMPLRVGAELIGVLELLNLGPSAERPAWQPLTVDELPMVQTLANLTASVLKHAWLYAAAQRSERRLKAFDAVVTAISTATDLHDLVHSVLAVVMELVPETNGALLLLDPALDSLYLTAQHNLPSAGVTLLTHLPIAEAPCAEVVYYGQPMLRPLLTERGEGDLLATGLETCAYLPLLAGGTVTGVLALYGDSELNRRTDKDLLMPICNQVGFAIANVRLYADSSSERRKLHTVVTSIAEGVLLCDAMGRLTLANDTALMLLGLEALPFEQPLTAMPDFYAVRDLDGERLELEALPFARALAGEVFQDYRLMLRGASGDETVMSFSGAPTRAADGTIEGAVVVFRDITASQKVARAKDEFLAVAAHELRSPLAAVRSYADLLLRREQQRSEADPRDLQGLTILTQQVSHMLRMVDNLLDVSRIDAGQIDLQLQRANLVALAAQVLDQQRPSAGANQLSLEAAPDTIMITCDTLRIRQVLTNLISNAVKYSPPDSTICLRLGLLQPEAIPELEATTPMAQVRISNEGAGIPAELQGRLFERYYRVRSSRAEGLGLGLYLSRQFVQMHGGRIWVESSTGNGTTFVFTLPIEADSSYAL